MKGLVPCGLLFPLAFCLTYDITFKDNWFPKNSSKLWMAYIEVDLKGKLQGTHFTMMHILFKLNNLKCFFQDRVSKLMNIQQSITRYIQNDSIDFKKYTSFNVKHSPVGWYNHPADWMVQGSHQDHWDMLIYVHPTFSLNITIITLNEVYLESDSLVSHRHCEYKLLAACDGNTINKMQNGHADCQNKTSVAFCDTPETLWTTKWSNFILTNSLYLFFQHRLRYLKDYLPYENTAFSLYYQATEKRLMESVSPLSNAHLYFPHYFYSFALSDYKV